MSITLASLVTLTIASLILESYGILALSLTGLISATPAQLLAVKLWDDRKKTISAKRYLNIVNLDYLKLNL
jgi:RNase H-fold protein (predicted Holliday junction resolvase)